MATKPKLFVGSSTESLRWAQAIQANLDHDAEITLWTQNVFLPGDTNLEALVKCAAQQDFAAFLMTPDDETKIRGNEQWSTRDNTVLELGLFSGILGRSRCFMVQPRHTASGSFRLPTDLLGIASATYDPSRSDGNKVAALGAACTIIGDVMQKLGPRAQTEPSETLQEVSGPVLVAVPSDKRVLYISDAAKELLMRVADTGHLSISIGFDGSRARVGDWKSGTGEEVTRYRRAAQELLGKGHLRSTTPFGEEYDVAETGWELIHRLRGEQKP